MKKLLTIFCTSVLVLGCLTACTGENDTPQDTHTDEVTTEVTTPAVTETAETEAPVGYSTVEQISEDDSVIQVEQVGYPELEGMDMSGLPESYAAILRGICENIRTYQILYRVDGCTVAAYVSVPNDYTENTRPLIIFNRGGNGNFGAYSAEEIGMMAQLTDCVVIASQYRETKPGTGTDEFGGADVADVLFWVDRVKDMGFVDHQNVYMVGGSRGGMQTCLALRADKDRVIRAAVCVSGIYDLFATYEQRADMRDMLNYRVGGTPTSAPEKYEARSPIRFVDEIQVPLLMIHSTGDEKVAYSQAADFAEAMQTAGKSCELITRETASHGFETPYEWTTIMEWLFKQ